MPRFSGSPGAVFSAVDHKKVTGSSLEQGTLLIRLERWESDQWRPHWRHKACLTLVFHNIIYALEIRSPCPHGSSVTLPEKQISTLSFQGCFTHIQMVSMSSFNAVHGGEGFLARACQKYTHIKSWWLVLPLLARHVFFFGFLFFCRSRAWGHPSGIAVCPSKGNRSFR